MKRSLLFSARGRSGSGAISLIVLVTLFVLAASCAHMTSTELRFSSKTIQALHKDRAVDELADAAMWLSKFDGAVVAASVPGDVVLVTPDRCVRLHLDEEKSLLVGQALTTGEDYTADCSSTPLHRLVGASSLDLEGERLSVELTRGNLVERVVLTALADIPVDLEEDFEPEPEPEEGDPEPTTPDEEGEGEDDPEPTTPEEVEGEGDPEPTTPEEEGEGEGEGDPEPTTPDEEGEGEGDPEPTTPEEVEGDDPEGTTPAPEGD